MCPRGAFALGGRLGQPIDMCCHVLLVETDRGLVLVDTGLGEADVRERASRLGSGFCFLTRPRLSIDETAAARVHALGFSVEDVRHVVVTHLDVDHAGGIPDFPHADVHVFFAEHRAAMSRATAKARNRYVPAQWAHHVRWKLHDELAGERWFGFECVRQLEGLPPEILLVPLRGHSRGHSAVVVDTGPRWLLHAGDAYFHRGEMDPDRRRCPPLLDVFQRIVEIDGPARLKNQERLRALVRENSDKVRVFSAHDPVELERCRERAEG